VGLFDFFRVKTVIKLARPNKVKSVKDAGERETCGTVNIDSFIFPVKDFNSKGLMIESYNKDVCIMDRDLGF
jgi:hypothetical protein